MNNKKILRIVLVGGTHRMLVSLQELLKKDDVDVLMIIIQKDYPWDEQWHSSIEELAIEKEIPCETYDSGKYLSFETIKKVQELKPDVIIGGGIWRSILQPDFWKTAQYGYISLHGSMLPEYRGFANLSWHIINGEKQYGMQMFRLGDGIDDGDLVYRGDGTPLQTIISLDMDRSLSDILKKIEQENIRLLVELIDHLKRNDIKFVLQDEGKSTWTCHRGPEDGEIDWNHPTLEIYNFIRAQSHPYPGAFSFYKNQKFHIWKVSIPLNEKKFVGRIPGKIVERKPSYVDVLSKDGIIRIEEISVNGKKIEPYLFLKSIREKVGYNVRNAIAEIENRLEKLEGKK